MKTFLVLLIAISARAASLNEETTDLPEPIRAESNVYYIASLDDQEARTSQKNISALGKAEKVKNKRRKNSTLNEAIQLASLQGFNAMIDLYERKEPEILRKGQPIKARILMSEDVKIRFYRRISRRQPSGCAAQHVQCTNDERFGCRG